MSGARSAHAGLDSAAFAALMAPLGPFEAAPQVAVAVSGGADSLALALRAAGWAAARGGRAVALTVDHGLRPESAAEARQVAAWLKAHGMRHHTLVWEGTRPTADLQAAARAARYRLLAEWCARRGVLHLLLAHHRDDQAETLLLRLARGSGLDGLSAMAPLTEIAVRGADDVHALKLARPLLEVPKARLRATLEQRGIPWFEDPSNQHPAFERTRLRAAAPQLEALGLTADMLTSSARRLQRAREAIERSVADFCAPDKGHVAIDPCGVIRIDAPALRAAPAEIAVRVLSWAVAAAGGLDAPVALASIEAVAEALATGPATGAWTTGAWTLARAKIAATTGRVLIEREPGREPLPAITLAPGSQALWDGRFLVTAGPGLDSAVDVRALGPDGVREARRAVQLPSDVSAPALRALPAFWRAERLIAVPSLGFWPEAGARGALCARFTALGNYNSKPAADDARSP
jgi:tRNA(Ile)-lysidine synthase